jgi:hypothetical protein
VVSRATPALAQSAAAEPGFRAVAASISIIVLGANTPLPLLTVYQAQFRFSAALLTVIYGLCTGGVILAVFVLGPASDRVPFGINRRRRAPRGEPRLQMITPTPDRRDLP